MREILNKRLDLVFTLDNNSQYFLYIQKKKIKTKNLKIFTLNQILIKFISI